MSMESAGGTSRRELDQVERIAVLRANGIGDLVFALPALEALRATYPSACITLLGRSWHQELLEGRPGPVDEIVTVPLWKGIREEANRSEDPAELEEFFTAMRAKQFDLALQIHGGGKNSNVFVKRLGARLTAGMRAPGAPPLDRGLPYLYYQPEVTRLLEVVSLVGAAPVTIEPRLAVIESDREEAGEFLGNVGSRLAALNPGAGDTRRRWPPEYFAAVGDLLARQGFRVVVTGSADDLPLASAVYEAMNDKPLVAAGRLGLGGLLGLFERCGVVVSNDSGPLHLAAAVGAPTVGIFWCGNLINAGPFFRSRCRPQLSWRLDCPVCGVDCTRGECSHGESFVADVPVAEVTEAALDLLEWVTAAWADVHPPEALLRSAELQRQGRGGGRDD